LFDLGVAECRSCRSRAKDPVLAIRLEIVILHQKNGDLKI
jgi:hypothetical protein